MFKQEIMQNVGLASADQKNRKHQIHQQSNERFTLNNGRLKPTLRGCHR